MERFAEHPAYLSHQQKPLLLVGSGEHYGALLNTAFDFETYFRTLSAVGLNQTRVFSGTYREIPGAFGIEDNTLAPLPENYLAPWQKVGDRWDLSAWNPAYFDRLHALCRAAATNNVFIEFVLFCFWYGENLWQASPMHPQNNIQNIGPADKEQVYLPDGVLWDVQEAFTRKVTTELRAYDNVYIEVCNEPYSRQDHTDYRPWQTKVAATVRNTNPNQLIALNVQNRTLCVDGVPDEVTILNFHYALPEAVLTNRHLGLVIADDETGFAGQEATPYRREAWRFLLSGGAIFSHLDYSFTTAHPDGTATVTGTTPGHGSAELRRQLAFLRQVLEENEVWHLEPHNEIFVWHAGDITASAMAHLGHRYLLYHAQATPESEIWLSIAPGKFAVTWLDPVACTRQSAEPVTHTHGYLRLRTPAGLSELGLLLDRLAE
jgi:hypothetical protein